MAGIEFSFGVIQYTQKLQMRNNDIFGFDDGDLPIQCGDFRKGTSGERDFLEKAHHKITL